MVGVEVVLVLVGTVTVCRPKSKDGLSSTAGDVFFWASSFSLSLVYSSFSGSLLCGPRVHVYTPRVTHCLSTELSYIIIVRAVKKKMCFCSTT